METGRALTNKGGDRCDTVVFFQLLCHLSSHLGSAWSGSAFGHINFYGQVVALGNGHKPFWRSHKEHGSHYHRAHTDAQCHPAMGKTEAEQFVIARLQIV